MPIIGLLALIILINGCSSIGKIDNKAFSQLPKADQRYLIHNYDQKHPVGVTVFLLVFSGGDTYAAACIYWL
ncbi:MAG: hypothetical protein GY694_02335 [Gammaproteobacteria bacterium]|nr:hypothetical protein [Gammaproteobacteria bacterium]